LRDEISEPLTGRRKPPPRRRLAPVALWGGRLIAVAAVIGAAALYQRGAISPRAPEVAVIPFDAIKTVEPTPTATPSPAATAATVFPAPAEGGVTVVRSGSASAPAGRSPQIIDVPQALGNRLSPAPDRRLTEPSKYGPLPRVGADGALPADVYARPFAETALTRGAPRIAVFVGGLGLDAATTQGAISRLPAGVSLGLAPYGGDLAHVAQSARASGHEIWLQAPMESVAAADPGPHTLKSGAGEAANRDSLQWMMGRFPGYVGVVNYLGGKFAADADALTPVLAEISRRGLIYLDDGAAPLSKAAELAPSLDLKAARADTVADGPPDAVDAALARAEEQARRNGSAIVTATALPLTLDHIARWALGLEAKGFALAPVSALIGARPARAAKSDP
jgi:polysaccharide deacetylase 2 family uncharacterized protein YibQ